MKQKPWPIVVLAFLHVIAPVGNILMNAFIRGRSPLEYIISVFSVEYVEMNWPMLIFPPIAGYAINKCRKWSFFVYLAAMLGLFVFNFIIYSRYNQALGLGSLIAVITFDVAIVSYFLIPAVRRVYFDRRVRWWEPLTRFDCDYECEWKLKKDVNFIPGRIKNISKFGLYIDTDVMPKNRTKIDVRIQSPKGLIDAKGSVRRHKNNEEGFGFQFSHTRDSKQKVVSIINEYDAKMKKEQGITDMEKETIPQWLHRLFTKGEGWLPEYDDKNKDQ